MITLTIDPDLEQATIETPDGMTTIVYVGRVGDRPEYLITSATGRVSFAYDFRTAVEYLVSRALKNATAIRKIRGAPTGAAATDPQRQTS